MKKLFSTLAVLTATVSLAAAGDSKVPVGPKIPLPPDGCDCFGTGFEFSGFGGALIPDNGSTGGGGGVALSYFFTEAVGVELSYGVYNTDPSEEHVVAAELVYRFVNRQACIAPYVLLGGGVLTNSDTQGLFNVGGGLDIRCESLGCAGLFVDATYNWVGDDRDFTLIRGGIRIPF